MDYHKVFALFVFGSRTRIRLINVCKVRGPRRSPSKENPAYHFRQPLFFIVEFTFWHNNKPIIFLRATPFDTNDQVLWGYYYFGSIYCILFDYKFTHCSQNNLINREYDGPSRWGGLLLECVLTLCKVHPLWPKKEPRLLTFRLFFKYSTTLATECKNNLRGAYLQPELANSTIKYILKVVVVIFVDHVGASILLIKQIYIILYLTCKQRYYWVSNSWLSPVVTSAMTVWVTFYCIRESMLFWMST